MQQLNQYHSNTLLSLMYRPAPISKIILIWDLAQLHPHFQRYHNWLIVHDESGWSRSVLVKRNCMWCLSPAFGKQAILQALRIWVEIPTLCDHIFLIYQTMQREFGHTSTFFMFDGIYNDVPLPYKSIVAFLLLYIPIFNR